MTPLLLVLLTLHPLTSGLRCIACDSDPSAPNWACLGGESVDNPGNGTIDKNNIDSLSFNCTNPDDKYCLTTVTWESPFDDGIQNKVECVKLNINHIDGYIKKWNRRCCKDASSCGKKHDVTESYEIWRDW